MARVTYEIRVEGEVPNEVLENFEGVTSEGETLDTTLRADLADAAALHGLLLALRQRRPGAAGRAARVRRTRRGPHRPPIRRLT